MNTPVSHETIRIFIMDQINKLYCAQSHLYERLSEIADHPNYADLRSAMRETILDMIGQLENMDELYSVYNCKYSFEKCHLVLQLLEEDFNLVQLNSADSRMRDFSMLNYLQNIQNMITAAFQMIQLYSVNVEAKIGLIMNRNFKAMRSGEILKQVLIDSIQVT